MSSVALFLISSMNERRIMFLEIVSSNHMAGSVQATHVFTSHNHSLNVFKKSLFCEDFVHIWIWILSCQTLWIQTRRSAGHTRCKHMKQKLFHFFTCFLNSENIFCLAQKESTICLVLLLPVFLPFWNCLIHQVETAALCIVSCSAEKFNMEHDSLLVINIIISSSILLVAYKYIFVTT